MQVLLNTDHHTHGTEGMADHVQAVVKDAVSQFGEHVTRVVAHIAEDNSSTKSRPDEIQCTLEARLVGLDPVVVKDRAGSVHQALHGAAGKLKRALATALQKHEPRQTHRSAKAAPDEFS